MIEFVLNRIKTTWGEKVKILVTSIFSFSYSGFKRLLFQGSQNLGLYGKGLSIEFICLTINNLNNVPKLGETKEVFES